MKPFKPDPKLPLLALDKACEELSALEKRTIGPFEFCYLVTRIWSGKIVQAGKVRQFWRPEGIRYQIQDATVAVKEEAVPSQTTSETPPEKKTVQGIIFYPEEDELPGQYRQPPGTRSPSRQPRKQPGIRRL